jgi:DNA (cytosine-5)-methyltransferase 1
MKMAALSLAPDLKNSTTSVHFDEIEADLSNGSFKRRWKSGGCAFGNTVIEGLAPAAPTKVIPSSFVDALDDDTPDERYFLTANAATGVLRRVDGLGRNLFRPMRRALEILVRNAIVHPSDRVTLTGETIGKSSIRKARAEQRREVAEAR